MNDCSVRRQYQQHGVDSFYKYHAHEYTNPHLPTIQKILHYKKHSFCKDDTFLDMCCGTGEITSWLTSNGFNNVDGVDPYMNEIYESTTGRPCYPSSFKDIAINGLQYNYTHIICSFAIHLCPKSLLPQLLYQLSTACEQLIILSPSKISLTHHFTLESESKLNRVHCKIYTPMR